MGLFTLLLLALGMSVDAFAAALARGASSLHFTWQQTLKTALIFGVVESITPLIGYTVGSLAQHWIEQYDHWLAFGLLAALGIKMIVGALSEDDDATEANLPANKGLWFTITTAIATSIDSMIVGVGLAFLDVNIWLTALTIGLSTTIMAAIGLQLGRVLGTKIGSRAEIVGGIVLIGIGVSILLEHTDWLQAAFSTTGTLS